MNAWITSRNVALRLTVLEGAPGSPVAIFVHGLTAHAGLYRTVVPGADYLGALRDEGLTVVGLDLPGHGMSEGRRGHLTFRDAMEAISEAVGWAIERYAAPVGLTGSSLGGALALYAGLEDQRVGGVAVHNAMDLRDVSPFLASPRARAVASLADEARWLAGRLPLLRLPALAGFPALAMFEDPANVRRWRRAPRTVWWYTLASIVSIFFTPEDKPALEAMTRPVLVATGEEDPIFPLAAQRAMVERLGGPSELFVLPGAGHELPLEHTAVCAPVIAKRLREML